MTPVIRQLALPFTDLAISGREGIAPLESTPAVNVVTQNNLTFTNTPAAPSYSPRTMIFPNQISYEERLHHPNWNGFVGGLWHNVLSRFNVARDGVIVEVAPGEVPKVGLGLKQHDFAGHLFVVEPEAAALESILAKYRKFMPKARVTGVPFRLEQALRQGHLPKNISALIANNPIDDMIIGKFLGDQAFVDYFRKCYDQDPAERPRELWNLLDNFPEALERIQKEVAAEWIAFIESLQPELTVISQSEPNVFRLKEVAFADAATKPVLHRIGLHFGRDHLPMTRFAPPQGGVYDPRRWLVLEKNDHPATSSGAEHRIVRARHAVPLQENVTQVTSSAIHRIGELKICLGQMEVIPHDPEKNFQTMRRIIQEARVAGADMVVFPQMCLTGHHTGDRLQNQKYVLELGEYDEKLREESCGLTLIWGNVDYHPDELGHDGTGLKYIAARIANNGEWVSNGVFNGKTLKYHLVDYRGRNESRHFSSLKGFAARQKLSLADVLRCFPVTVKHKGRKPVSARIGITIGEDIWREPEFEQPARILFEDGMDLHIHLAASDWTEKKDRKRREIAKVIQKTAPVPLIIVNGVSLGNVENNYYPQDGGSLVVRPDGLIHNELPAFQGSTQVVRVKDIGKSSAPVPDYGTARDTEQRFAAIGFGLTRLYESALVAVSGGIDSSVTMALAAHFLGSAKVYAVNLPHIHNDEDSLRDFETLTRNFGVYRARVPITPSVDLLTQQLEDVEFVSSLNPENSRRFSLNTPQDPERLAEQTLQVRERGQRIMTLSKMTHAHILNTATKEEIAIGHGSIHGSWLGVVSILGDVFKSDVYRIGRYINDLYGKEMIPESVFARQPSTGLLETGDEHPFIREYHGPLIRAWLNYAVNGRSLKDPEDILASYLAGTLDSDLGLEVGTVDHYFADVQAFIRDLEDKWSRYHRSSYKWSFVPPVYVLTARAVVHDQQHSQGPAHFTTNYKRLRQLALATKQ